MTHAYETVHAMLPIIQQRNLEHAPSGGFTAERWRTYGRMIDAMREYLTACDEGDPKPLPEKPEDVLRAMVKFTRDNPPLFPAGPRWMQDFYARAVAALEGRVL